MLRACWGEGDADALRFTGRAKTALADEEVSLIVSFTAEDGQVTGVRVNAELPASGVAAADVARRFGFRTAALPELLPMMRIAVREGHGVLACVGEGDGTRLTVLRRDGRGELLVAGRENWLLVSAPRGLPKDELAELAGADPSGLVPVVEDGLVAGDWLLLPGRGPGAPVLLGRLPYPYGLDAIGYLHELRPCLQCPVEVMLPQADRAEVSQHVRAGPAAVEAVELERLLKLGEGAIVVSHFGEDHARGVGPATPGGTAGEGPGGRQRRSRTAVTRRARSNAGWRSSSAPQHTGLGRL